MYGLVIAIAICLSTTSAGKPNFVDFFTDKECSKDKLVLKVNDGQCANVESTWSAQPNDVFVSVALEQHDNHGFVKLYLGQCDTPGGAIPALYGLTDTCVELSPQRTFMIENNRIRSVKPGFH